MKNSTELDINIKELLSSPLSFKIEKSDSPQVLIIHTHTTETYMTEESDYYTSAFSSRTREKEKNMAAGSGTGKKVVFPWLLCYNR